MGILKDIWHVFVLGIALSYFGGLFAVTLKLGLSAIDLHEKGLVSLSKFSRMLVGPSEFDRR